MFKQNRQLFALLVALTIVAVNAAAQEPSDSLTLGVRYFSLASAPESEYKGDAKALASSLRIALDATRGFKQIVTLDDEQVQQLTKLIADVKKGAYNGQLPGDLAKPPDAYVFPTLLSVSVSAREKHPYWQVSYTVEMSAEAVDPETRAVLFSDKAKITEIRNQTEHRGGAKNVHEDLVSKAVDRLAAKLAAYFLKRGRVLRVTEDKQTVYVSLGSKHGVKPGDRFTVHKVESEGALGVGDDSIEDGLAEFDLDAKGTIEITDVIEIGAKGKIIAPNKGAVLKGDAVRWIKP
jgi:hypothetical protein